MGRKRPDAQKREPFHGGVGSQEEEAGGYWLGTSVSKAYPQAYQHIADLGNGRVAE